MDETKRSKQEALDKRYIRMASIWAEKLILSTSSGGCTHRKG